MVCFLEHQCWGKALQLNKPRYLYMLYTISKNHIEGNILVMKNHFFLSFKYVHQKYPPIDSFCVASTNNHGRNDDILIDWTSPIWGQALLSTFYIVLSLGLSNILLGKFFHIIEKSIIMCH